MSFYISTEKRRLDVHKIQQYICNESYWGKGKTFEVALKTKDAHTLYARHSFKAVGDSTT